MLEVSRQSITKWETGSAFPELKKLLQLSVILDKDLDWLLCDERSKMIAGRKPENRDKDNSRSIYDMKSLEEARWSRMISGILEYLDGKSRATEIKRALRLLIEMEKEKAGD